MKKNIALLMVLSFFTNVSYLYSSTNLLNEKPSTQIISNVPVLIEHGRLSSIEYSENEYGDIFMEIINYDSTYCDSLILVQRSETIPWSYTEKMDSIFSLKLNDSLINFSSASFSFRKNEKSVNITCFDGTLTNFISLINSPEINQALMVYIEFNLLVDNKIKTIRFENIGIKIEN